MTTKVHLLRWRIEEYFRLKKQQFELEDLRVMSLQSIRNLNLLAMLAVGNISLTTAVHAPLWHKRLPATESQITTNNPI